MKKTIQIFSSIEELSAAFAKRISGDITRTPKERFYSIALSGGSTPRAVFKFIAENYADKINWSRLLVFWGDERCVPTDDDESNYKMAFKSLLGYLTIPDLNIFRIQGENDPLVEANNYSEIVNKLLLHKNGIPQFDLFMLGLGEDGHTASIFPDQISLFGSDKLFEASQYPVSKQTRITATGKLINNSKQVCFLVTGESKAEKVAQIIEKKVGWQLLPASFIHPEEGTLIWMLDEHAGHKLIDKNNYKV
jgi:6-phosphogluconolactonase